MNQRAHREGVGRLGPEGTAGWRSLFHEAGHRRQGRAWQGPHQADLEEDSATWDSFGFSAGSTEHN